MPISPRAPEIGLPTFWDSIRASSSPFSSTRVASRRRSFPRSPGDTARHSGYARLARATALSSSSTPARSSSAIGSSVAGLTTVSDIAGNLETRQPDAPEAVDEPGQDRSHENGHDPDGLADSGQRARRLPEDVGDE